MGGDKPRYVEAVVVVQGKIAFAGAATEAMSRKSASTVVKELADKTMLPGFVDAHSHFINTPTLSQQANVSPSPVGVGDRPRPEFPTAAGSRPGAMTTRW
jgi:predicted amidohydrolase YtcJ